MATRRTFLAASSAVAATALGAGAVEVHEVLKGEYHFDEQRFSDTLGRSARHRQCFAATKLKSGEALYLIRNSLNAYQFDLGEGPGTLHCAAVLYHGFAAALAFNDAVWNELLIPSKITDGGAPVRAVSGAGNPYLHRRTGGSSDISIEGLSARGTSFFLCHNAILDAASQLALDLHLHQFEVVSRLLAGVVPYAQVVPAGVMAINALQEAHFTYINGS